MKRRARVLLLLLCLPLGLVAALLTSDYVMLSLPTETEAHYVRKTGSLLRKQGIVGCWDFNELMVREWASGGKTLAEGVRIVQGREGTARRFVPAENGMISSSLHCGILGSNFTVSCWLKLPDPAPDQTIMGDDWGYRYLQVRDGRLHFRVQALRRTETLSCAAPAAGEFVHVAAVVDSGRGRALLYIAGEARASIEIRPYAHGPGRIVFGQNKWSQPADFALDAVTLWKRALDSADIAALGECAEPLAARFAPYGYRRLGLARGARAAFLRILHTGDRLFPAAGRFRAPAMRSVDLILSNRDIEVFQQYHACRVENGMTARDTSKKRKGCIALDGWDYPARIEIVAPRHFDGMRRPRKTYSVEIRSGPGRVQGRSVLLHPPEGVPFMTLLLAARFAPDSEQVRSSLCRLHVNGVFVGVYVIRDSRDGSRPLLFGSAAQCLAHLQHLSLSKRAFRIAFDALAGECQPVLAEDPHNPLTSRELGYRMRLAKRTLALALRAAKCLDPRRPVANDPRFPAMPSESGLPSLHVLMEGELDYATRIPCAVELRNEGGRVRSGFVPGRIRHRGNRSLLKARKKYFSIRMSAPHDFFGLGRSTTLNLTSCWRDATFMREKLAYDLFRAFGTGQDRRVSPHAHYVELFLNSEYHGIYCLSERVDADLLRFSDCRKKERRRRPGVLYKAMGPGSNFRTLSREDYVQKEPDWKDGPYWRPYEELIQFLGESDATPFAARAERMLDVDNVIDFQILVNLTNNREGRRFNLFLARQPGRGTRFYVIPWDYDMTYRKTGWLHNHLFNRLRRDLPGYPDRLRARWRYLRGNLLSEPALMTRLDVMEDSLAGAVERNVQRWPSGAGRSHEQEVAALRDWIRARLTAMDAFVEGYGREE